MALYGTADKWAFNCLIHDWTGNVPCPDCAVVPENTEARRKEAAVQASMNHCTCGESKNRCPVHEPEQVMTVQECPVQAQVEGLPLLKANERQVGGAHYGKVTYQHWDFVTDVNLHYLVGCASKYVTRHRDKNGTQDLEKALHYLQKAEERDVEAMTAKREHFEAVINFAAQLPELERRAVESMCMSNYSMAAAFVRELLAA